ncbi:hypothetical protein HYALB_00011652 [Hymenoscyphus albidus]|uniref:Uncharacterized protein n=1 Tax=Hymenoscyphus albidus TaxID=595503 RepID=A0A9N9LSJ9_9HELO|nr:hypothetical protein HYALB_00011652 [Hymenoscyphus albidus]
MVVIQHEYQKSQVAQTNLTGQGDNDQQESNRKVYFLNCQNPYSSSSPMYGAQREKESFKYTCYPLLSVKNAGINRTPQISNRAVGRPKPFDIFEAGQEVEREECLLQETSIRGSS